MFVRFVLVVMILVAVSLLAFHFQEGSGAGAAYASEKAGEAAVAEHFAAGRNAARVKHDFQESRRNYFEMGVEAAAP